MTTIDNYCKYIAKPATAAAIGAVATKMFASGVSNKSVIIAGMSVPVWAFSGLACALGSALGSATVDTVSPHITTLTLLEAPAHTALTIGLSAGSTALAFQTLVGEGWNRGVSMKSLFVIAAVSEVGSSYVTETFIRPAMTQYMN